MKKYPKISGSLLKSYIQQCLMKIWFILYILWCLQYFHFFLKFVIFVFFEILSMYSLLWLIFICKFYFFVLRGYSHHIIWTSSATQLRSALAIFFKTCDKNKKFLLLVFLSSRSSESLYFAFFPTVILLGIFIFLNNILKVLLALFNFRYYLMVSTLTNKNVLLFRFTIFLLTY